MGLHLHKKFNGPEQLTGKLYARVIVAYITKEQEERLDCIGVEEVSSTTALYLTLIIVGTLVLVGGIIALLYFLVFKKKNDTEKDKVFISEGGVEKLL